MKISPGNKQSRQPSTPAPPSGSHHASSKIHHPRFAITKHISFWHLTFNGQKACFDHEQGAYYVAYLLLNPPSEPVHGMALALRAQAEHRELDGETLFVDPRTSEVLPLPADAMVFQRNLAEDDAEALASLRRKQIQLEAILDEENHCEASKAEVLRELEAIYDFQKTNKTAMLSTVQKVVRAVRRAIHRFHEHMATAVDPWGKPHPVLRPFAAHIEKNLIIPSARYCRPGHIRAREETTGTFTYEPPPGVKWMA